MKELDIDTYLNQNQISDIISFIENNFKTENNLQIQLDNVMILSRFIKEKGYILGEIESENILRMSPKLLEMFNILYLADKLVNITNHSNLYILTEVYLANTNHNLKYDIDEYASHNRYGNKGLDIIKVYFGEINEYKLLTKEEEVLLASQGFEGRQKLIEHNLRLVVNVAHRYKGYQLSLEDIIQAGNEGLIIAARKFNSSYNCKFATYALWWIKQRIKREFAYSSRTIRISYGLHVKVIKAKRLINKYTIENDGKELSDEELASMMNITIHDVHEIKKCIELSRTSSYDKILESEKMEFGDEIEDENNSIIEKTNEIFYSQLFDTILNINVLTEQEAEVIKRRFGFYGEEYTLQEIGDMYGVTRERVRQIESKALKKIANNPEIKQFDYNNKTEYVKILQRK